jgi:hypothetical protein
VISDAWLDYNSINHDTKGMARVEFLFSIPDVEFTSCLFFNAIKLIMNCRPGQMPDVWSYSTALLEAFRFRDGLLDSFIV